MATWTLVRPLRCARRVKAGWLCEWTPSCRLGSSSEHIEGLGPSWAEGPGLGGALIGGGPAPRGGGVQSLQRWLTGLLGLEVAAAHTTAQKPQKPEAPPPASLCGSGHQHPTPPVEGLTAQPEMSPGPRPLTCPLTAPAQLCKREFSYCRVVRLGRIPSAVLGPSRIRPPVGLRARAGEPIPHASAGA